MIYKNSTDPIELKKISLIIYPLRAYLEAFIRDYVKKIEYTKLSTQELTVLFNQYYQDIYKMEHFPKEEHKTVLPYIQIMPEVEEEDPEEENNDNYDDNNNDNTNKETDDTNEKLDSQTNSSPKKLQYGIPLRPKIPNDSIAYGKTLFTDINIAGIGFFSTCPYLIGQTIVIEFELPHTFSMSAEVAYCKNYNVQSRIISTNRPPYRLHANFTFQRNGERTLLRNFLESMEPERNKGKGQ
ncbi:MAG: hypothetical protein HQK53_02155 [Oligoflexia bacterium]|nr:hypothetical protein [Oligoflexia bacterium]